MRFSNKKVDVCKVFCTYWIILIVWQNAFNMFLRGTLDFLVKTILLGYLTFSILKTGRRINKQNTFVWLFFLICQMTTFFLCDYEGVSLGIAVMYIYPVLVLFLIYCVGNGLIVNKSQVERMNNYILAVVIISIVYTLAFEPMQYIYAISAKNSGYGSELSSFFSSMHEYAIYLFYSIIVCINRIADNNRHRYFYYLLSVILWITLIFTFSRTAIAAGIVYLLVFSVLNFQKKVSKIVILVFMIAIITVLLVPSLNSYLFKIVWKSGSYSSREALQQFEIDFYRNGSIFNKLFGFGIYQTRQILESSVGYGSVHNAYLQVLIYYGITGLAALVIFILTQIYSCIKFFRVDKNIAVVSLSLLIFCVLIMVPQTFVIFSSSIDCFFITIMFLVIPKYQRNAVLSQSYY